MKKWEYKVAKFLQEERYNKTGIKLQEMMNELGSEGWELVNITTIVTGKHFATLYSHFFMIFKF